MELTELNSEFDVLFEELNTNGSKGLDKYEKSLCYSYAQESIIFELAQKRLTSELTQLLVTKPLTLLTTVSNPYSPYGKTYSYIEDSFQTLDYIIRGTTLNDNNSTNIVGANVSEDVITDLLSRDYKYPNKNIAYVLRVQNGSEIFSSVFVPFNFQISEIFIHYVEQPTPIVLENLDPGDSIDGIVVATEPVLDDKFKDKLVEAAVNYAQRVYVGIPDTNANSK